MKTTFRLIGAVATAAALFSSCKKEAFNEEVKPGTVEMTIIADVDDATRTVLGSDGAVTWSASEEQLAVMEVAKGKETTTAKKASNVGVTTDEGATMTFGVSMNSKTADSFDYYALYPNSAYVDTPSDFTKGKVKLASTQAPTESSFGPSADVLVAMPVTNQREQPTELHLQFARVIAVGKMTIKDLDTRENVKKVTFTAAGKAVTGSSYIDFTTAKGVEYGYLSYGVDNVVLDYSNKTIAANGMTAYFTCWPFELAAGETFSVVVETENYIFTKNVTLDEGRSLAFKAGRASEFNVNFADVKGVAKEPVNLKYELVQASDDIVDGGKYLIVYNGNCALGQYNADKKYYEKVDVTADNNIITITDQSVVVISLEGTGTEGQFYIKDSDDQYMYYLGSSNVVQRGELSTKYAYYKWTVTKDKITNVGDSNRFFQYNTANPRFTCYLSSSNQKDVTLYVDRSTVKAKPSIGVQKALDVPSAETTASFPVTLTNVKTSSVNVYKDAACTTEETEWITADFNDDKTAVEYVVMENTGETRNAYIKIYAQGTDAAEASAIVTVTQAKAVALTAYPYSESFAESQGEFTIDNVTMPSPLTYVWKYTTYSGGNYMKASAYVSGTNYATESWLISPVIDMSSAVNPVLSFMTVARYGSNENLTLWAREKGGDWAQLSFSNYGTGNDWNFVSNTVDLSAYAGKTLQFAYKYVSTDTGASTWEIKNVEVKEQGAAATLSSIAWTGYTTTYTVGDVFKADGTVTATYSDGSTKDVTSEASFSTPDMSTAGAKTVTITYEGETTTGEITVKDSGSTGGETKYFVKVTSAPADWSGEYLIVYEDGNVAFDGSLTKLDAVSNTVSVTIANSKIEATNALLNSTFTINAGGTTIKSKRGYYIGNDSNSNALTGSSTELTNTLSFVNGDFTVISKGGAYLRYNSASNQTRFRYYKSGSYTGQKAIQLYKLEN